jgi:hypothetical protein
MFMQPIVGTKWSSYSAKLVFITVPEELRAPAARARRRIANPSLLELRTFHIRS